MQMSQGMSGLGGATGDDDALESFLDSYLTNGFGTNASSGFVTGMQQQPAQQIPQQFLASGSAGHIPLSRPGSFGQAQTTGAAQNMNCMGLQVDDTSKMSIPALQALLRQRQLQQQQASFNGVALPGYGQVQGMGATNPSNLLRPTSLQDHLSGGMSSENSTWRPTLGTLTSTMGMQAFNANHGGQYMGESMSGFQETALPNVLAPAPILRPASDSLLVNQRSAMNLPGHHGFSSLRINSISAQNGAATIGIGSGGEGGGGGSVTGGSGALGGAFKKSTWDATNIPVAEGSDDSSEDDSSQRRRIRGRSASTNHAPSVQQEKNRSAQRRFRQRQKEKMSYLESRTEVLTVQVDKLTEENESLRSMNTMLEKVLNLREEHISNLQEAAKVFSNLRIQNDEGSGSEEAAMGDAVTKTVKDVVAAAGGGGNSAACGAPIAIKLEDPISSPSNVIRDSPGSLGLLAGGGHVLPQNMEGVTTRFTAEAIRSMSAEDVIDAWKENLKELSRYVVLTENSPPSQPLAPPVLGRITSLTASMSELVHKVAMISPLNVKRLLATNMELHAMVPVPEAHWARVLQALGLSERQQKHLLGARERFLAKFEALVQERTALVNSLVQQAIPRAWVYAEICSSSLATHEATDRLRANLQREHNINMEFVVFVFRGVLDLLQIAKAAVHSYPYYPDVLAMSNLLSAQQPTQSQQKLQQLQQQMQSQASLVSQTQSHIPSIQLPSSASQPQQQQQPFNIMMPSQQQAQQQMGGLLSVGSAPPGAAVMFGTRVMPQGVQTSGGGGGGASAAALSCDPGGLMDLMGFSNGGSSGGMGSLPQVGGTTMCLGLSGLGMSSLASLGATSAATASMLAFSQQSLQTSHQQEHQQQTLLHSQQHPQDDTRMADS